jgi:hypothetical protein
VRASITLCACCVCVRVDVRVRRCVNACYFLNGVRVLFGTVPASFFAVALAAAATFFSACFLLRCSLAAAVAAARLYVVVTAAHGGNGKRRLRRDAEAELITRRAARTGTYRRRQRSVLPGTHHQVHALHQSQLLLRRVSQKLGHHSFFARIGGVVEDWRRNSSKDLVGLDNTLVRADDDMPLPARYAGPAGCGAQVVAP